jgi:DNA uptake protein ComE-like DNA-binding protein
MSRSRRRRGVVSLTVIWAIAIAAVVVAATQVLAFRQAALGRETLARTQARWAARAGVETMLAIMEWHTANPDPGDPMAMPRDLEANAAGELETGSWDIRHFIDGREWAGPMDEHAKLNINLASRGDLERIPGMTQDVVDSILDWRDPDHEVQGIGAERDYYRNRSVGYEPRNGDFRSIAELELVAGAWPKSVRGEDWNMNGRLDPNEDDGRASPPEDRKDGVLDQGWSGFLTAVSRGSSKAMSGQDRLDLRQASPEQIMQRTGVDATQAAAIQNYARQPNASLGQLLAVPLAQVGSARTRPGTSGGSTGRSSVGRTSGNAANAGGGVKSLSKDQLAALMNECELRDPRAGAPKEAGRLNLNTVSRSTLIEVLGIEARFADAILRRRASRPEGLTSLADLADLSGASQAQLLVLAQVADVASNVYTIASRGRAASTGAEAEMVVVVDRSELPARILEYREP